MNIPKNLNVAVPTRRFIAFLIDFALGAIVGYLLYAFWGTKGLFDSFGGNTLWQEAMEFYGTSNLYNIDKNDDGTWSTSYSILSYTEQPSSTQEQPGYVYYLDATYAFYTDYLPNNGHIDSVDGIEAKDYYNGFYYNTEIIGLPSDLTKIDVTDTSTYTADNGYFKYALTEDGTAVDTSAKPVLSDSYQSLINASDAEAMTKLYKFFINGTTTSTASGVYYDACVLLSKQSYLPPIAKAYNLVNWSTNAICFGIPLVAFFLLIPLVTPNGETLGRLLMKVGVASNKGTKIGIGQRLLHPWIVAIFLSPFVFVPSNYRLFALAGSAILVFVNFAFALRDKSGAYRSLEDRLCGTVVFDKKTSTLLASEEEVKEYEADHNMVKTATNETIKVVDSDAVLKEKSIIDFDSLEHRDSNIGSFDSFEGKSEDK